MKQVALETGFDESYIEQQGEYAGTKSMFSYLFSPGQIPGAMDGLSANDFLWVMQRKVILELAEKGPCVIVGRCSDYILRDREDCLHVFIHANPEKRAERVLRLYGEAEQSPEKRLEEKDQKRRLNYKHYTDRVWGMAQNYHITLDSGVIGIDNCVKLITDLVNTK